MNYKQQYYEELEKELTQFLFLCGKKDGNILISKAEEFNIDEHVRLACIAIVFEYKKLLLKIIAHCEKYNAQFMKGLEAVSENFIKIDEWVNSFIENIEQSEARKLVHEAWRNKKATLDINNFNIRQLLK